MAHRDDEDLRRVGDVAHATGLTVRTLHHYEEIGLIAPTARSDAGYRLYGAEELTRLEQIAALKRLGLPLERMRATFAGDPADVRRLLDDHLRRVEARLAADRGRRGLLVQLVDQIAARSDGDTEGDDVLTNLMEGITMLNTTLERRIAILVYEDLEAAFDHLVRVFGFGPGTLTRGPDGDVVHGEIEAGDGVVWLHPVTDEFGLRSPQQVGASTATMAVMVDDVDAHFRHASAAGADIRYEPVDQPYGYREYAAHDLEGHLWSFMRPLE